MNTAIAVVRKEESLYVAYAPETETSAWGSCRDEALNNLQQAVRGLKIGTASGSTAA